MDVNKVLTDYEPIIKKNVDTALNFIIGVSNRDKFLSDRCITEDDIFQEVCIKLWELLVDVYDDKYDLDNFIGYQTIKHATWIIQNIRRSGNFFTGTERYANTSLAFIDKHKLSIHEISQMFDKDDPEASIVTKYQDFQNNEYLTFGGDIDYYILIDEVILNIKNDPSIRDSQKLIDIFLLMLNEPELFSDLHGSKNKIYVVKQKFGYTTDHGARLALKRIETVVINVLKKYSES
jgi:hypothetical protein